MNYVQDYLAFSDRDSTGWPKGLPESEKQPLMDACKSVLKDGPLPMGTIVKRVENVLEHNRRAPQFCKAVVLTWIWACVHRALLAVDATTYFGIEKP